MATAFGLERWLGEWSEIELRLEQLVASRECAELTRRPGPGMWSVVEVVEHLDLTGRSFLPLWDEGIPRLREGALERGYGLPQRGFLWFLEPPYRMKFKTAAGASVEGKGYGEREGGVSVRGVDIVSGGVEF
jgi:hypothetical protein